MNDNNIVNEILEDKVEFNDVYYHGFHYNPKTFIKMINEGIKSPILIGKPAQGNNGYFYVCLAKKENCEYSVYNRFNHLPMFIINSEIKVIKTNNFRRCQTYFGWAMNLPLPFRESEYDDEYQKFLKVSPKDILAIQYNLYYYRNSNSLEQRLLTLKLMIEDLKREQIDLSIIDRDTLKTINQDKVLKLKL